MDSCSSDRAVLREPEAAVRDRAQAPKERPILFSGAMVRALLAGTKTQTRRVLPTMVTLGRTEYPGKRAKDGYSRVNWLDTPEGIEAAVRECKYGQPGDRLWVRETWSADPIIDDSWASTQWSGCGRVVSEIPERFHHPRFCNFAADWLHGKIRWTPSIHMPRWASRITLEVTGVRVERLQDISEADARAEGCPCYVCGRPMDGRSEADCHCFHRHAGVDDYRQLWEQINGPGSWDANPWVWALSFRKTASGCSHTARTDDQSKVDDQEPTANRSNA